MYFQKTLDQGPYTITFTASEEELDYNTDFEFSENEILIIDSRLDSGDGSAWFDAHVNVNLKNTDLNYYTTLSACTYDSYDDFIDSVEFQDMVKDCIGTLYFKRLSTIDALLDLKKEAV